MSIIVFTDDHSLEVMAGSSKQILQGTMRISMMVYWFYHSLPAWVCHTSVLEGPSG